MARIERVVYRSGFVKRLREAAHLPAITIEATDLPGDVLALLDHRLLDLGGIYGDPEAGDPIQHDHLRVEWWLVSGVRTDSTPAVQVDSSPLPLSGVLLRISRLLSISDLGTRRRTFTPGSEPNTAEPCASNKCAVTP